MQDGRGGSSAFRRSATNRRICPICRGSHYASNVNVCEHIHDASMASEPMTIYVMGSGVTITDPTPVEFRDDDNDGEEMETGMRCRRGC